MRAVAKGWVDMSWIIAKTRSRQEDKAVFYIQQAGVITYLPKILEQTGAIIPLFPRYVFVFVQSQWRFLLSTIGVIGVIKSGGGDGPAILNEKIIEKIKQRQNHQGIVILPTVPKYVLGQRVLINTGCFEGKVGIYQSASSFERENVLLNLLGRLVPISVSESSLVAAA
jgi:transcriptional antiterminator RfaH